MRIRASIQASPRDGASWLRLAREVEGAGFEALYVADHPGSTASPFVALAAAAAVTERIRLGPCVLNAGVWEPFTLAREAATLDVVSGGRAVLGVGAGHTPQEWTATGRGFPSASERVGRMIEVVEATTALLDGGPVTRSGRYVELVDAELVEPRPVQDRVPLLVGGNGRRVLRFAAERADVVGITGLGRTLADGHSHEVDWTGPGIDRTIEEIRAAADGAGTSPELEALVQVVQITDDAEGAAARLADQIPGAAAEDLLGAPFAWIGTTEEIVAKLRRWHRDLSISRYAVRAQAMAHATRVLHAAARVGPVGPQGRSHTDRG